MRIALSSLIKISVLYKPKIFNKLYNQGKGQERNQNLLSWPLLILLFVTRLLLVNFRTPLINRLNQETKSMYYIVHWSTCHDCGMDYTVHWGTCHDCWMYCTVHWGTCHDRGMDYTVQCSPCFIVWSILCSSCRGFGCALALSDFFFQNEVKKIYHSTIMGLTY